MSAVLGDVTYTVAEADRAYRIWVRDGRLVGLPVKRRRRLPLLDLVAQDFEPGQAYRADQVRDALARWHPDTAALGRYLVEEGFLDRLPDGSRWWRSGGTVDLDEGREVPGRLRSSGPGGPARAARRPSG
ncbi:MAG: DUF2087 domain-containing protein [Acidimicrobiales bacterium]